MNDKLKIIIPLEIDKQKSDSNIKAYLKNVQNNIELKLTMNDSTQQQSRLIKQANDIINNIAKNISPLKPQIDFEQFNLSINSSSASLKELKNSFEDFIKSTNKNDLQIFKDLISQDFFEKTKDIYAKLKGLFESSKNLYTQKVTPYKGAQKEIDAYNSLVDKGSKKTKRDVIEKNNKKIDNLINNIDDEHLSNYLNGIKGSKASFDDYNKSILNVGESLAALTLKTIGLKAAQLALNAVTNIGIGLLINFAVSGITKWLQASKEAIEKSNELTSTFKQFKSEIRNNISTLQSLESEYDKLSRGIDEYGKNIGLSTEEYKRYQEIVQQIADISPSLVVGYNDEGTAIINCNDAIQEAIKLQEELNNLKTANYLGDGENVLKGQRNSIQETQKEITKAYSELRKLLTDDIFSGFKKTNFMADFLGVGSWGIPDEYMPDVVKNIDTIISKGKEQSLLSKEEIEKIKEQISLIQSKNGEIDNSTSKVVNYLQAFAASDTESNWFGNIQTQHLDDFNDALKVIASDGTLSIYQMRVKTAELGKEFVKLQGQMPIAQINDLNKQFEDGDISVEEYNRQLKDCLDKINSMAEDAKSSGIIGLAEIFNLIADEYKKFAQNINTNDALKKLNDDSKNLLETAHKGARDATANFDKLSSVFNTLDNKEKVSLGTILDLIERYPEYRAQLLKINENRQEGIDLVKTLTQVEADNKIQSLKDNKKKLEDDLKLLESKRKLISLEQIHTRMMNKVAPLNVSEWEIYSNNRNITSIKGVAQGFLIDKIKNEINELDTYIENILNASKDVTDSEKSFKDSSYTNKDKFEKEYSKLQNQREMDKIDTQKYYDDLKKLHKDYLAGKAEYIEDDRRIELQLHKLQRELSSEKTADIEHEISMLDYQNEEIITIKELVTQYKALKESKEGLPSQHVGNDKNVILYEKEAELLEKINEAAKKNNVSVEEYIDRIDRTNPYEKQISLYKQAQDELLKQIEYTKSLGLLDNNDYLQGLEKQLVEYQKKIVDLEKKNSDDIKKIKEQALEDFKKIREEYLQDEIDSLNSRKSIYESVVNAVTDTIDKEVKSIENSKDAFVKSIDERIDKLNEEKDSLSKLQKEYETAFSVVNDTVNKQIEKLKEQRDEEEKSWNDKINALKEQNDEIEKQIELEKAQEALEKARNQKNTLIYREGIGFEYEANFDEVNKAKESLDNLNRKLKLEEETKALEELRDNALEIINSQIKGWEEYGQKWSDIVDSYRKDQDLLIAQQILGKNWESDILHQRTDKLGEFANEYADISYKLETEINKQIADLEREKETQIEVYDAKIEKLNEYKEKWTEIVDDYTLEQDRLKAAQILGADWEKEILDNRLSTFKTFRDEYINIIEELARKQESLNNLQNAKVDESGQIQNPQGGSNKLSDDYWKSYNAKATLPDGTVIGVNIDGSGRTTTTGLPPGTIVHTGGGDFKITGGTGGKYDGIPASSEKNIDKAKEILKETAGKIRDTVGKIFGFADGTTFAPGGLSVVDELGQEMIVRNPFQGRYTYLENGDGVIPHSITETLMKLGSNPIDYLKQSIGDIRIPKTISNQPIQEIIDIGDIKVYGVQNVDGLANAIITELPNMMLQKLYRK